MSLFGVGSDRVWVLSRQTGSRETAGARLLLPWSLWRADGSSLPVGGSHVTPAALGRCTAAAPGSEVSLGRFRQHQLVQRQVRHRTAQPLVCLLQALQLTQLLRPYASIRVPPAVIGLFGNPNLADRIDPVPALPRKHLNLTQPLNDFLGLVQLDIHDRSFKFSLSRWTNSVGAGQACQCFSAGLRLDEPAAAKLSCT